MADTYDALVLGAGFVGLGAALALQARGRRVALIDRLPGAAGETSFGNSGIVQSEAVYPYTFPRRPADLLAAALNRDPRAHIRHEALPALAPALWRYYRASAAGPRARSAQGLRALVAQAVGAHRDLIAAAGAGALIREGGWIKVFRTARGLAQGLAEAEETRRFGVPFSPLDRDGLAEREPHMRGDLVGAVHFSDPLTTSDPNALGRAYLDLFRARGGDFAQADAETLAPSQGGWRVGALEAREAVVALGPWSDALARRLGYRLPFFVKRGYHMHYAPAGNAGLSRPVLDYERGYLVTPMARGLRLTTGAEFARPHDPPSSAHLDRVEPFAREIYPLAERRDPAPWMGARPCLPDMLPVIGPAPRHKGLWFDFAHQHLGLTLGPISGQLLAQMMTGVTPFADPAPYALTRFG